MNQEAQNYLNSLINKSLHELTPTNITFLRARRSYLTSEQEEKFSVILEDQYILQPTPEVIETKEEVKKGDEPLKAVFKEQIAQLKYNDPMTQAKLLGYMPKGKGRAKRDDLELFVLENS